MSEDWDTDLDNNPAPTSYSVPISSTDNHNNDVSQGFNSYSSGGISVGKGKGRGYSNLKQVLAAVGSKPTYNGGSSNSGYGNKFEDYNPGSVNSSAADDWEETPSTTYNNDSSNQWQPDASNNRGSNSSGSRGGKGCYNCGKEGHMGRDCPDKNGDSRGGNKCYKCGEEGHMSRDCSNGGSSGGSNKSCFKCKQEGHISRDCPNGGSSGGGNKSCYKCGEEGHMSRECPSGGSSGGGNKSCYKCGEEGHMSRECPSGGSSGGGNKSCYKCGEEGHMSRECPKSEDKRDGNKGCFRCGEEGHMAKDCTNEDKRVDANGKPREAPYIPPEPSQDETSLFEGVPTGINFTKYDSIPVKVSGTGAPSPIMSFEEAKLRDLLYQNIRKSKYEKPTPVQKHAIPIILAKRDMMACAQTGSGKTAAFLVPILQAMFEDSSLPNTSYNSCQEPWAVIISPTRELAIQIYNEARKFAHDSIVKIELIYGGTSVSYQLQKIQKGCHILVATPGRLLDFVEKGKIAFSQLKYLILDEADRMLDMGFIPEVRKVVSHATMTSKRERQTLMFSATFPEEIQHLAFEFLKEDYLFLAVGIVGAANTDVEQSFFLVEHFEKRQKLLDTLKSLGSTDRTLVFVESKRTADFIASYLSQSDLPTTSIHGDRLQREREEALWDFRRGKMPILVATAVAARGLDIKDVRNVINYDLPKSIDEYVHRIGRTGRVGNTGRAISFYDSSVDKPLARSLLRILKEAQQEVPAWLEDEASSSFESSGFSNSGGPYGARDVRRNKPNTNSNNEWEPEVSNNYVSDVSQPAAEEESWD